MTIITIMIMGIPTAMRIDASARVNVNAFTGMQSPVHENV